MNRDELVQYVIEAGVGVDGDELEKILDIVEPLIRAEEREQGAMAAAKSAAIGARTGVTIYLNDLRRSVEWMHHRAEVDIETLRGAPDVMISVAAGRRDALVGVLALINQSNNTHPVMQSVD